MKFSDKKEVCGNDEVLPIFLYLIMKSNMRFLVSTLQYGDDIAISISFYLRIWREGKMGL